MNKIEQRIMETVNKILEEKGSDVRIDDYGQNCETVAFFFNNGSTYIIDITPKSDAVHIIEYIVRRVMGE